MKITRNGLLIAGLLILFAVVSLVTGSGAGGQNDSDRLPPLSVDSSQPDGARALWLWLQDLGYDTRLQTEGFSPPADSSGVLCVLVPTYEFQPDELQRLDGWLERGGTLILAGDASGSSDLLDHFQATVEYIGPVTGTLKPQQPLLVAPPPGPVEPRSYSGLALKRADAVIHLASGSNPLLVSLQVGAGRVLLASMVFPFSNEGLSVAANARLVYNLFASAPDARVIVFQEGSLGPITRPTLGRWLVTTPAGWGVVYAALVVFLFALVTGRRFGRPVALTRPGTRRSPVEYVTAMSHLFRRAGQRRYVLQMYHDRLKRDLARPYRLNPDQPDESFVDELSRAEAALDFPALLALLQAMRQPNPSEDDLVRLSAQAAGISTGRSSAPFAPPAPSNLQS